MTLVEFPPHRKMIAYYDIVRQQLSIPFRIDKNKIIVRLRPFFLFSLLTRKTKACGSFPPHEKSMRK